MHAEGRVEGDGPLTPSLLNGKGCNEKNVLLVIFTPSRIHLYALFLCYICASLPAPHKVFLQKSAAVEFALNVAITADVLNAKSVAAKIGYSEIKKGRLIEMAYATYNVKK